MIVLWRVTERCNLSCPFCAFDRTLSRERREADPAAVAAFGEVLSRYRRKTGDDVLVSWLGGEPLLWDHLPGLTRQFTDLLGLRVSTTTNGTGLGSHATRDHIRAHYSELTISVDGLAPTHERLRDWPGGFARLRRGVTLLLAEARAAGEESQRLRLRANVVLMRDTIDDFELLCFELASWGIDEITVNQLGGVDRPEFYPDHRLRPVDAESLAGRLPALRTVLADRKVKLGGGSAYLRRILASSRDEALPVDDCGPGERFLFIDTEGQVAPCSFTADTLGVPMRELDSVEALLALPDRMREAKRLAAPTSCENCLSTQHFGKFVA